MLNKNKNAFLISSFFSFSLGFSILYFLYSLSVDHNKVLDMSVFLILLIIYAMVILYPIYNRILTHNFDIFEPPVWASITYGFAFGILGIPLFSPYPRVNPLLTDYYWFNLAFFYVILGIGCLWVGYKSRIGVWLNVNLKIFKLRIGDRESITAIRLPYVIALYGIGLLARVYMIKNGLYAYLSIRSLYLASLGEAQILMHLENFCRYGCAIAALYYFNKPSIGKGVFFGSIFGFEFIFGFISGMKSNVIMALLIVSIAYFYSKKIIPKGILLSLVLILIFLYPLSISYRDSIDRGAIDSTNLTSIFEAMPDVFERSYSGKPISNIFALGYQYTSSRLSMLESLAVIIKDMSESGDYWFGKYYVYFPMLVFLPRIIWENKPVLDFGIWFTQNYWNPSAFHSTAITYPGDFYLNFGLPGLILGMLLTGIIYRLIYERFKHHRTASAIFIYIFVFISVTNHEGDFLSIYTGIIKQLIELLIISYFVFDKRKRREIR